VTFLNEIQKIRSTGSTGSGSLVPSVSNKTLVERRTIIAASSSAISSYTSGRPGGSESYGITVNHGSGQFSSTSRINNSQANTANVFCQPFTVNQTTGAITVGSGSNLFSGSSNLDTGSFAWSGEYIVTNHTSGSAGNSQTVGVVSGNSVTGYTSATSASNNQPVGNEGMAFYRSGSTMYWYPNVYSTSDGFARRQGWSFNGSSISNVRDQNPSANTSTHYTYPVVPRFGQNSPTSGYAGLRFYRTSSAFMVDILNGSGGESNTFNLNNSYSFLSVKNAGVNTGYGLELSNGNQIFYSGNAVYLSAGNNFSILTTADVPPKPVSNSINNIISTASDTWVCISQASGFPPELVKFSINPSTYVITIIKSVPLTSYIPHGVSNSSYPENTHISFTGTNNKFMVLAMPFGPVNHLVHVFDTPF
jgi:hypothetical protein